MSNHGGYRALVTVSLLTVLVVVTLAVSAAAEPLRSKNKSPQARQTERIHARQAKAWGAYYAGRYKEAVKLAAPLLKVTFEWARVEASHCRARCYWAAGTKRSRTKAKQIWAYLEKSSTLNVNLKRVAIAKALAMEAERKDPQAIEVLEDILKSGISSTCTAEAAIELARLQVRARRFDDAQRALDFAIGLLKREEKREIPPAVSAPFIAAARKAKDHLKYDRSAGRKDFEQAEVLRRAKRHQQALQAYRTVVKKFPATDYAPRSDLNIGHCIIGLKRLSHAFEHWRRFIAVAPGGPWRGQAYLGIIDTCLERLLDLAEAGKYAELARSFLATALADEKTAPSWQSVQFDIQFRAGIVAYLQGRHPAAAEAFRKAHDAAGKAGQPGLKRLVAAAQAARPILPEEVRDPARKDKVALVLAMGSLYNIAWQFGRAEALFDRILTDRAGRPTPVQAAFATFGKAVCLQARGRLALAKAAYVASLQALPKASWHDETLCRVATIIQRQAREKYANKPRPSAIPAGRSKRRALAHRKRDAKKENNRRRQHVKARGAALPYWRELIKHYPKSPYVQPAMYNLGLLYAEAARWKQAANLLDRFVQQYPTSPFAGDAYVRLIDIALERMFDMPMAQGCVEKGVQWAGAFTRSKGRAKPADGTACEGVVRPPTPAAIKNTIYKIYLRAGLVAYLDQKYDEAVKIFRQAKPFAPPRKFVVVHGHIPTGIERMLGAAKAKKKLTPNEVHRGDPKAALILQLAGIYAEAAQYDKAITLCDLVINSPRRTRTDVQRSWAHYQKARSIYGIPRCMDARADYLAAQRACPDAPWAPRALFYTGTITNNFHLDKAGAVAIYKEVVRKYPNSDVADKAAYFVGVTYEWNSQWALAKAAYAQFLKRYPDSQWVQLVQEHHLKEVERAMAAARHRPRKRR